MCRSCGAKLAPDERKCPSCGYLNIDSRTARLGSRIESTPPPVPVVKSTQPPQSDVESSKESAPETADPSSGKEAKPDSHYAVAPQAFDECPNCGTAFRGSTCPNCGYKLKGSSGGCGSCTCFVFLLIMLSILSTIFIL